MTTLVEATATAAPARARSLPLFDTTRAELRRMLRWPATWVLAGVWLLLNLLFGVRLRLDQLPHRRATGPAGRGVQLRAACCRRAVPDVLAAGHADVRRRDRDDPRRARRRQRVRLGHLEDRLHPGPVPGGRVRRHPGRAAGAGRRPGAGHGRRSTSALSALIAAVEGGSAALPAFGDARHLVRRRRADPRRCGRPAACCSACWPAGRRWRSGSAWSGRWWWRTCCAASANALPAIEGVTEPDARLVGRARWPARSAATDVADGGAPGVLHVLSGPVAAGWTAGYLVICVAVSLALVTRRDLL